MGLKQIKAELCSSWGTDRDSANSAWASSYDKLKAEAKSDADVVRVVSGMVVQHHDTPKERVWMEFFITCPIFVERQFDKYRMTIQMQDIQIEYLHAPFARDGITQNELSGRYRTIPDRPYELPRDVAEIYAKADAVAYPEASFSAQVIAKELNSILAAQHDTYQAQLQLLKDAEAIAAITNAEYKRAREVLRGVLGTAYLTDMRIVMNANAFEHIISQRLAKEAQLESRVVAYHMVKAFQAVAPVMAAEMIGHHDWDSLLSEVEAALLADDK